MPDTPAPSSPALEEIRERLGYVVVTINQASGQPDDLASGDILYTDPGEARDCRDWEQERTRRHGRRDRHVVAEVFEVSGDAGKEAGDAGT